MDNVVDNAVTHNEDGGWIEICGSGDRRGPGWWSRPAGASSTSGRSTGWRGRSSGSAPTARVGVGSGLGLSIVAAVAAAHGGRLDLLARPEGGLRVSIALPAARVPVPA